MGWRVVEEEHEEMEQYSSGEKTVELSSECCLKVQGDELCACMIDLMDFPMSEKKV